MIHTIIVPGVGGSDSDHWQSWLQRELMSCSRVQQKDWNLPILKDWMKSFVTLVAKTEAPIQIVAHSFGCLTSVAALAQHPELTSKIKKLILVAPANPARFGANGFARNSPNDYATYFHQLKIISCILLYTIQIISSFLLYTFYFGFNFPHSLIDAVSSINDIRICICNSSVKN